jgi:hypothetical protein
VKLQDYPANIHSIRCLTNACASEARYRPVAPVIDQHSNARF